MMLSIFTLGPGGIDTTLPELKLQKARKRARRYANKKLGEESVKERVKCVAFSRVVYGDCHWLLAKAYAKLAQSYLELRGRFSKSQNNFSPIYDFYFLSSCICLIPVRA